MKKVWIVKICLSLASVFLTSIAHSQVYFKHKDWEVACDNTGTCRAAGYQSEGEEPVSMLINRTPGAGMLLSIQIKVLDKEGHVLEGTGELRLSGLKPMPLQFDSEGDGASINGEIATSFMRALTKSKANFLTVTINKQLRRLSLEGLNAVLLKTDEVQKRIGTKSAFVALGVNDDVNVLLSTPKPKLKVQELPHEDGSTPQLLAVVSKAINAGECSATNPSWSFTRLSESKLLLARLPCWIKTNDDYSNGYWLIDQATPSKLQRIGQELNLVNFRAGQIFGTQSYVQNSDECGSNIAFSWNGSEFVQTLLTRSELCRGIVGRAWDLKIIDFDVEALRTAKKTKRAKRSETPSDSQVTAETVSADIDKDVEMRRAAKAAKKVKKAEVLANRQEASNAANAALNPESVVRDAAIRALENSKKD